MEKQKCTACLSKSTAIRCDICTSACCKQCCYFIDEDSFELYSLLPDSVRDKTFCPNCYHEHASEVLDQYHEHLEQAQNVDIFVKEQGRETRLIRRIEKPLKIENCEDREETILRLAFLATQLGFNTLLDVSLSSKKVSDESYTRQVWSGTAVPTNRETE